MEQIQNQSLDPSGTCRLFVGVVSVAAFVHFESFSPFLSQFPPPYSVQTGGHKPPSISPAPLPSAFSGSVPSVSYFSPTPHHPILPLTLHSVLPPMSTLGAPQTPLSTPPLPLLAMTVSFTPPQQPNIGSFLSTHPLPLSQVQPTPYPVPHPDQELAEQPVQVNI